MNILLPVSRGPSFQDSVALAIDVAKSHDGFVRVLYVVDRGEVRRVEETGGFGAIHLAQQAAEEVRKRMMDEGTGAVLEATNACALAGVPADGEIREGEPFQEILAAAAWSDMVVASRSSHFAPGLEDKPGRLVLSLMRDGGVPVLLACSPFRPIRTVVAGCGGGYRSRRAVGAMAKHSLWKTGFRMILLAADDSKAGGEERLAGPRSVLADAGYPPWEERVVSGPKAAAILGYCEEANADAVVLGGWGEHRWDDLLGFSITGRLVEEGRRNLFLYM